MQPLQFNPHKITAIILALAMVIFPLLLPAQTKTCNPVFQNYYGGQADQDDEAKDVAYCAAGGMIVCGQTTSYSTGLYDGFLLKLKEDGVPEWTRVIGGSGNDKLIKVRQTEDGGYIALGETTSFLNKLGETWVVKTDAAGNIQWNRRYGYNSRQKGKTKGYYPDERRQLLCCNQQQRQHH